MRSDIETFAQYARGRAQRGLQFASQLGYSKAPSVEVTVASGMHSGSKATIDATSFTIGPDMDNDIVLLDEAFQDVSIIVSIGGTMLGPMMNVQSNSDDTYVANEALRDNSGYQRLPCEIQVGDIILHVAQIDDVRLFAVQKFAIGAAACGLMGLILTGVTIDRKNTLAGHLTLPENVEEELTPTTIAALEAQVAVAVQNSGLSDFLTVSQAEGGTVVVAGSLPQERLAQWQQIRQDADALAHGGVLLADINMIPELSNLPAVSAVKLGNTPSLILLDGRELSVGERFSADWVIQEITSDGFSIGRQGEEAALSF